MRPMILNGSLIKNQRILNGSSRMNFIYLLLFVAPSGCTWEKKRARFLLRVSLEALEKPYGIHEMRNAPIRRDPRIVAPTLKLSRFPVSQSCAERKAVKLSADSISQSRRIVAECAIDGSRGRFLQPCSLLVKPSGHPRPPRHTQDLRRKSDAES